MPEHEPEPEPEPESQTQLFASHVVPSLEPHDAELSGLVPMHP